MFFVRFVATVSGHFLVTSSFPWGWLIACPWFLSVDLWKWPLLSRLALNIWSFNNFRWLLIVSWFFYLLWSTKIDFIFRVCCNCFFLLSDHSVIKFSEVRQMMNDYLSVVFLLCARVIVQPKWLQIGQLNEISDLTQIRNAVLSQIQFLCLWQCIRVV